MKVHKQEFIFYFLSFSKLYTGWCLGCSAEDEQAKKNGLWWYLTAGDLNDSLKMEIINGPIFI